MKLETASAFESGSGPCVASLAHTFGSSFARSAWGPQAVRTVAGAITRPTPSVLARWHRLAWAKRAWLWSPLSRLRVLPSAGARSGWSLRHVAIAAWPAVVGARRVEALYPDALHIPPAVGTDNGGPTGSTATGDFASLPSSAPGVPCDGGPSRPARSRSTRACPTLRLLTRTQQLRRRTTPDNRRWSAST